MYRRTPALSLFSSSGVPLVNTGIFTKLALQGFGRALENATVFTTREKSSDENKESAGVRRKNLLFCH